MVKYLLPLLLIGLVGCEADPVSTKQTNNPQVAVSLLFENDGCKVYRFSDNGEPHYYAHCATGTVSTSTEIPHGKYSTPEEIATTTR